MRFSPTTHYTWPQRTSEARPGRRPSGNGGSSPDEGPEKAAKAVDPAPEGEGCKPNLTWPAAGPITPQTIMNANEDDYRAIVTSVRGGPLPEAQDNHKLEGDKAREHYGPRLEASGNPIRPASPSPHKAHRWRQRPGRSPPDSLLGPSPWAHLLTHWLFRRWNS